MTSNQTIRREPAVSVWICQHKPHQEVIALWPQRKPLFTGKRSPPTFITGKMECGRPPPAPFPLPSDWEQFQPIKLEKLFALRLPTSNCAISERGEIFLSIQPDFFSSFFSFPPPPPTASADNYHPAAAPSCCTCDSGSLQPLSPPPESCPSLRRLPLPVHLYVSPNGFLFATSCNVSPDIMKTPPAFPPANRLPPPPVISSCQSANCACVRLGTGAAVMIWDVQVTPAIMIRCQ